jgi:hypothetical protein
VVLLTDCTLEGLDLLLLTVDAGLAPAGLGDLAFVGVRGVGRFTGLGDLGLLSWLREVGLGSVAVVRPVAVVAVDFLDATESIDVRFIVDDFLED